MLRYTFILCFCLLFVHTCHAQDNSEIINKTYAIELQSRYAKFNADFGHEDKQRKVPFSFQLAFKKTVHPNIAVGIRTAFITTDFNYRSPNSYEVYANDAINFKAGISIDFSAFGRIEEAKPQFGVFIGMSTTRYTIDTWKHVNVSALSLLSEEEYAHNSMVIGVSVHDKTFIHKKLPVYLIYGIQSQYHLNRYSDKTDVYNHNSIARDIAKRDLLSIDFGIGYTF